MKVDLNTLRKFADFVKHDAHTILNEHVDYDDKDKFPSHYTKTVIDKKQSVDVLKKYYSFVHTFYSHGRRERSVILCTNAGNIIEDYSIDAGEEISAVNGRDVCLGDTINSFGFELIKTEKLSDFLALIAVFANKHA